MDKFKKITDVLDTYYHDDNDIYQAEIMAKIEAKIEAKYIEQLIEYQQRISKMNILHNEMMNNFKGTIEKYQEGYNSVIERLEIVEKEFEEYRNKKEWKVKVTNKNDNINPNYL